VFISSKISKEVCHYLVVVKPVPDLPISYEICIIILGLISGFVAFFFSVVTKV
jgi:hypothetical protein